ncbi:MAG: chorismate-binding protein [Corynebacterium sp.]|nr:chorismate-binding protein [Corynebacterium sp.]
MILLIDNYDSFTFNLYHQVWRVTGKEPFIIHNDEDIEEYLPKASAIIIGPGPGNPDTPSDLGNSTRAIEFAIENQIPLLGICLGHQAIAHYFGGTVERVTPKHGIIEEILYRGAPLKVMRYHSLAVTKLPSPLRPIAYAPDGTLMAFEHPELPILGIQFHPESVGTTAGDEIIREFFGGLSPVDVILSVNRPFVWLRDKKKDIILFPSTEPGAQEILFCTYEGDIERHHIRNSVTITDAGIEITESDPGFFPDFTHHELPDVLPALIAEISGLQLRDNHDSYIEKIKSAQQKILAGESYEVCLTTAWQGPASNWSLPQLLALFLALAPKPTPYGAFAYLDSRVVLSFSPEEYIRIEDCIARSRPIKGTAPATASTDFVGTKEIAENLMIVDLVRHDLGSVAIANGVVADPILTVETHGPVHQLISTISATLRPGVTPEEVLAAAFPPGSMTGAPKKRTMEILEELEGHPRGLYSGYIGYIGASTAASVVIRTLIMENHHWHYGVGGAITALSDPEAEWQEILHKSQILFSLGGEHGKL